MHPKVRRPPVAIAAAVALALGVAAPAAAAPDFSTSQAVCQPANGVTARPGEQVMCTLFVDVRGANGLAVTADTSVPPHTTFDATNRDNRQVSVDDPAHPSLLSADEQQLGFINPGFRKQVSVWLLVATDGSAVPGDPVQTTWNIHEPGVPDTVVLSNIVRVTPPEADLTPSTIACRDADAGTLLPGDAVDCTAQLIDAPAREDAANVNVQAQLPAFTAWAAGGDELFHINNALFWLPPFFPSGVPSGPASAPPLHFRLTVSDATPGGTVIAPLVTVTYNNALSSGTGYHSLFATLVTAPGPAIVTASSLTCADGDQPPLLPGDTVTCILLAMDQAGREDVAGLVGSAPVPASTTSISGAPDAAGVLQFGAAQLGTLAAGSSKSVIYRLRVDDAAAPGTQIVGTARLTGHSVPTGTPVAHALTAAPLVVGRRPGAAAPAAAGSAPAAAAATLPPKTAAPVKAASRICGSRRVVVVNVRPPKGGRWTSVTVAFAKKSVKGRRASGTKGRRGYFRARLVFQGLPKGPLKVTIRGKTAAGRRVTSTRTYKLCTKKGG